MARFFKIIDVLWVFVAVLCGFMFGKEVSCFGKEGAIEENGKSQEHSSIARRAPSFGRLNSFSSQQQGGVVVDYSFGRGTSKDLDLIVKKLRNGDIPESWEKEVQKILECSLSSQWDGYNALLVLFSKWAEVDFLQAFKYGEKIGGRYWGILHVISDQFAKRLAEENPKEALQYYLDNVEELKGYSSFLTGYAFEYWAKQNPEELLNWCFSHESVKYESSLDRALLCALSEMDFPPGKSREYIEKLYSRNGSVSGDIIRGWAEVDSVATLEWLNSIEKDEEYSYYKKEALKGVAKHDLGKVTELISKLPENERSGMISDLLYTIENPQKALSWFLKVMPSTEVKINSLSNIPYWSSHYPNETEDWIEALPLSVERDLLIGGYAINDLYEQPYTKALELVNRMENKEWKTDVLRVLFRKWDSDNSDGFHEWLKKSGNSELLPLVEKKEER